MPGIDTGFFVRGPGKWDAQTMHLLCHFCYRNVKGEGGGEGGGGGGGGGWIFHSGLAGIDTVYV